MIPARVVASVAGTVKHPAYDGRTLLAVRPIRHDADDGPTFLALDLVGATIGDAVLVARPTGLGRQTLGRPAPVRSYAIGILDEVLP